jgi:branched-chain amino acid aminotransferase
MHQFLLHNDDIRNAGSVCITPGQVGLLSGWGVFTTMRVARGVLFAFERHFARMRRDARLLRVPFPEDPSWLEERLLRLIQANEAYDSTLRTIVLRNKGGLWQGPAVERDFDLIAFTTELKPWSSEVRLGVVPHARHSQSPFSGTKVLSWAFNLTWYEEAQEHGRDEVVLLNERDEVSECTSANIFAVFGNEVRTPPLSSGCLPGITRELLLELPVPGLTVSEKVLKLKDLEQADEVFITSSTRDLLPVREIEGLRVQPGRQVIQALQDVFRAYQNEYVETKLGVFGAGQK